MKKIERKNVAWGKLSDAEYELLQRESGLNCLADNAHSTAFGAGQMIQSQRIRYAKKLGIKNPDTTDCMEQLAMFRAYYGDRYGSDVAALNFHLANRYY